MNPVRDNHDFETMFTKQSNKAVEKKFNNDIADALLERILSLTG